MSIITEDRVILPAEYSYRVGYPPPGYRAMKTWKAPAPVENAAREVLHLFMRNKYPIGTMIPFEADGMEYMARVEVHSNSPYGITVYEKAGMTDGQNVQPSNEPQDGRAQLLQRISDYLDKINSSV
jgi:hypothetical protein